MYQATVTSKYRVDTERGLEILKREDHQAQEYVQRNAEYIEITDLEELFENTAMRDKLESRQKTSSSPTPSVTQIRLPPMSDRNNEMDIRDTNRSFDSFKSFAADSEVWRVLARGGAE